MARAAALGIAFTVVAAACGTTTPSVTSPSGAAPANLNAGPGTPVREYTASISPTPTGTGTREFTVTITNNFTSTATNNGIRVRSAGIMVPGGVTGVTINSVSATGGKSWSANLVSSVIILGSTTGNAGLAPTESVTVKFNATIAECGTFHFDTAAYQDSLSGGALVTATPFNLIGTQPQVVVDSGCSGIGDCPAAPAIANQYLKDHEVAANDPLHTTIVNAVAQKMANGDFGRDPCAEGYADAVIAYINTLHQF
jgi:hypothetical protein